MKFQSVRLIGVSESILHRIYQYLSSIHTTREDYECVCLYVCVWNQLYCGTGNKGLEQATPVLAFLNYMYLHRAEISRSRIHHR